MYWKMMKYPLQSLATSFSFLHLKEIHFTLVIKVKKSFHTVLKIIVMPVIYITMVELCVLAD